MKANLILWLAQGFGIGRMPYAPGTWGSVIGIGWFLLLLSAGSPSIFFLGTLVGAAGSVWACGRAEQILGRTDPGSVVLDEIIAIPICFAGWVIADWMRGAGWPAAGDFLHGRRLIGLGVVFGVFRFFDVVKPWPVNGLQRLRGGWGVTADDVMAGLYTGAVGLGCWLWLGR